MFNIRRGLLKLEEKEAKNRLHFSHRSQPLITMLNVIVVFLDRWDSWKRCPTSPFNEGAEWNSEDPASSGINVHSWARQRQSFWVECPVAQNRPRERARGRHERTGNTAHTAASNFSRNLPIRSTLHESRFAKNWEGFRYGRRCHMHGIANASWMGQRLYYRGCYNTVCGQYS